ncbi:MAG TPA: hypothetical protein VHN14_24805 [Kofleriaceae bacterium]|jgi:hypothetical protein|nr:hypothetical protein [Kofleriaceae bacterium]
MDLEILEALALSDDRAAALAQLLPGSEDHDYYRALHAQHRGALDEVDAILSAWPDRHGRTPSYDRLRLRQLLHRVTTVPGQAADQVRDWFSVSHWHEAEVEEVDPARPSRLAEGAFDPIALLEQGASHDANLSQVTDEGISELVEWTLDPVHRRVVLGRLRHTAQPQIVELVAEDLGQHGSGGFGSLTIHRELTLDQLHALAERRPELRGHTGWVAAVVTRMRPPAGVELELDPSGRAAYLEALWRFLADLPPANNSLKAHVLWHLLDSARRRGAEIDRDLVRAYLALPRSAEYLSRAWMDKVRHSEIAQLGTDFAATTGLPPAGSDEELVREVLQQRIDLAESYAAWLDRAWLDAEIATAELLSGAPGADRATRVLGPARATALRDRVELTWCAHNPTGFAGDAEVALEVDVKNIAELVIKVFRIDPIAYFQHHHREVDTALDLDGLAASHEEVVTFSEPAIRRVRRRIALPACTRPGTYVIDLIGNGMSSRALVQKGRLRYVMRTGAAGHVITIFDQPDESPAGAPPGAARPRPDARAWIGDREYVADDRGVLVAPFSTQPARTPMLLFAGDIATVAYVNLVAEIPELGLALALDRQALIAGTTTRAIARLSLAIGGAPASLALLGQATWDITLIDRHGVATTRSQPLALGDDDAVVLEWPLGDATAEIVVTLRGRIEVRSEQREREIAVTRRLSIAAIHAGPSTEALYLAHTEAGWVVSALGKTGEPRAHRPVTIGIVHRWAWTQLTCELATDELGRVELGPLPGARRITATLGGLTQSWELDDPPPHQVPIYALAGQEVIVAIPASRAAGDVMRRASLVELRAGAPARHVEATLEPLAGAIAIRGLPSGEYQLRAPGIATTTITVAAPSSALAGWAITPAAIVQVPRPVPAIAAIELDDHLIVQLRGGDARTRVHVIATRFQPAPVEPLVEGPVTQPRPRADRATATRYMSGRELGDEYRYVLERRAQPRFPGLLLDKPSLLLNPWARRTTMTAIAPPRPGGAFAPASAPMMAQAYGSGAALASLGGPGDGFATYDFLAAPPVVLANLIADDHGQLRVPRQELGDATSVTVIVDDPAGLATRQIALAERPLAPRDLRLGLALDPERHATQRKAIAPLVAGDQLVIEDLATAKLHLIDSVERAHAYLLALRDDPTLREFGFVTRWHTLGDAERRALYSKYACHELHLFLYWKDRAFFDAVIRPYLAHKRVKTFVDHWLLDADLTPYLEPARLARCNAVERALLALRVASDTAIPRLLADEVATQAPDPARDAHLIDVLLGAATLDGDADIAELAEAAEAASYDASMEADFESTATVATRAGGFDRLERPRPVGAPAARQMAARPAPPKAAQHTIRRARDYSADDLAMDFDLAKRAEAAPMYRPADKTQEWAEHNWWHLTPAQSNAAMIAVNRLWRDLAHHTTGPFLSPSLGLATGSFAEAMCALAVTDLPFVPPAHAITSEGPRLTIAAAGNALAGSSQLVDGELMASGAPLVVGMSYVRADDRYDWSSGEQVDKYALGPLAAGVVYTCQVVLANPTSARQRISALVQIPRGSLPVSAAQPTHTIDVALEPYGTHGHEYSFYFPAPGRWSHFPVHVSRAGQIVAAAPGRTLEVAAGAAAPDPRSWPYLSQRGAIGDVVAYLATANLAAIDLPRVAWRMRARPMYDAILGALEARRAFDPILWGYALLHHDVPRIRAWLRARGNELLAAGPVLDMIDQDAEQLASYEHLELAPLVNARAHRLGPKLRILNDGLAAQYTRFLELVAHRPAPSGEDLLAAAHYLLAQDRVAPALAVLARLDARSAVAGGGAPAGALVDRMQYDYLSGYAACLTGDLGRAREVATRWRDHPVDRWRRTFAALAALLDEVDGAPPAGARAGDPGDAVPPRAGAPALFDPRSREQSQAELAARQPALDLAVDRDGVVVHSQHVATLELRFFEMDVELLFSRQPFVQSDVSRFSFIEPGHRETLTSPGPGHRVAWPGPLRGKNVVVEAVGAGMRKAKAHYANDLTTTLAHQYGQIRVQRASDLRALAATYVKVYARHHDGTVTFYKDGYTDLRGWFDYASLSTTELDQVERFAILVYADHEGAAILEAGPPAR